MLAQRELNFLFVAIFLVSLATGCDDVSGRVEWNGTRSSMENRVQPEEPISRDAVRDRARMVIQTPSTSFIGGAERCEVYGTFEAIPQGWQAYVLLESPYGYFLQWPPVRVDPARRTFLHRNIRIGPEISELHIALADFAGADALDRRAACNDWSAIPLLPEGVVICDTIACKETSGNTR